MPRFTTLALILPLALAACAGTPTTYLALAPVPGPTSPIPTPPIAVARVIMPAAIDRLYLTSATGPTTLSVADHARWVAPLDGEAQSALADDLAQRLPGATILHPGDPTPHGGARLVVVNVTKFLPGEARVVLNADWRIESRRHHQVIAQGRAHIIMPAGITPAAQAEAMSQAIGRLTDTMIAGLNR
jgi:uncharacterized lipoprotein YmbA